VVALGNVAVTEVAAALVLPFADWTKLGAVPVDAAVTVTVTEVVCVALGPAAVIVIG
jgi:hypothetical protein